MTTRPMPRPERAALGATLLAVLSLAGCGTNTVINEYRQQSATAANEIQDNEAVVILGRSNRADHQTETDFISCVGESLRADGRDIKVIPQQQFMDSMYPYFEASTAPMDVRNMDKLSRNPAVAHKLTRLNLRYFIWIDGHTETTDKSGSVTCAVGPGGGGCFGFASWDDESSYEATIWDFKQLALSGKISAESDGTSYLPAVIIPIPLLARVQAHACSSMAERISDFIQ